MKRQHDWEYKYELASGPHAIEEIANGYAADGWRLHSAITLANYTSVTLIFERPMRYHELVWRDG